MQIDFAWTLITLSPAAEITKLYKAYMGDIDMQEIQRSVMKEKLKMSCG